MSRSSHRSAADRSRSIRFDSLDRAVRATVISRLGRASFVLTAVALLGIALGAGSIAFGQERVIADFEDDDWGAWTATGEAFGSAPARGALDGQMAVDGFDGGRLVNSFHGGDRTTGMLESPEFELTADYLSFLIGGGNSADEVGIELLIDDRAVRTATGRDSERLEWRSWNVRELRGHRAKLRIFDRAIGGWGHVLIDRIVLGDTRRELPTIGRIEEYLRSPNAYREPLRPQFHFSAPIHWINDPNGLVYHDGEWHLFYQHNPHGIEWGHMSWGHAVSRDLVHWEHLPIALYEEYGTMAFSGSAVVDHGNTSGFGTAAAPPLVAIYTGNGHGKQTQDLAYSNDRGRTWTKYAGNPVIDLGEAEFRDPKVFRHDPSDRWVMVVTLAAQKKLLFFGSRDLKSWERLGEFGPAGTPNKANWECPDLFELPIENEPGETRWVLEADMGSGSVAGGSGGEYFIGEFDGRTFVPEHPEAQWVDWGRDFYAPISWSDVPAEDGRRIWLGWFNNWETCLVPTFPWRGSMSLPRELFLRRIDGQLRLCQRPVRELASLRRDTTRLVDLSLDSEARTLDVRGTALEIRLEIDPGTASRCGVRVLSDGDERTEIGFERERGELYVDRTRSGNVTFDARFPGRHAGPLSLDDQGRLIVTLFVDACSIEVFGGFGETVISDLVFPHEGSDRVELFSDQGKCRVLKAEVHRLEGIWPRR